MISVCNKCSTTLVIAGGYQRAFGTRNNEGSSVPSDGRSEWGRYQCHQCGNAITIPAFDEKRKESKAS